MNEIEKISVHFLWYDIWIGVYIDRSKRTIYICPFPMIVLKISLKNKNQTELKISRHGEDPFTGDRW